MSSKTRSQYVQNLDSFKQRGFSARTWSHPSLIGLMPGLILASVVIFAGGYYSIKELLGNPDLPVSISMESLMFSLQVAGLSTVFSLILGFILALWMWKQPPSFPSQVYTIPLILPHIVAAFFVVVFFSQGGIIASLFYQMNIIDESWEFPILVFDRKGIGIMLAYVYKETAFVALLVLAALRKIPASLMYTATIFAASRFKKFRSIIFPHISATLSIAGIIIFLYSFASYDIPYLLGSGSMPFISIEAYRLFFEGNLNQRSSAGILLAVIWGISMLFLFLFTLLRASLSNKQENHPWV